MYINMKVCVPKFFTGAILFALTLCQFAKALQHVDLAMCDETPDSVPYCIVNDSMGEKHYLHENATMSLLIKLPVSVLTELWLDFSKIKIVTSSRDVINNGQGVRRSEDTDRWTIEFNFQRMNSNVGMLHLVLRIKDVDYRDTQYLHVEIENMDTVFQTTEKIWIPVEEKSNGRDINHEGEAANSTESPVDHEDPSAILHAKIETLQNDTEALQQKLTTTENELNRYEKKYLRCLESKDDMNGTMKFEVHGRGQKGLEIFTVVMLLAVGGVLAYVAFLMKGSLFKPTKYNGGSILQHSAVTVEHVQDLEELLSTVQSTTPEDVQTAECTCTCSSQYSQSQNGTTISLQLQDSRTSQ